MRTSKNVVVAMLLSILCACGGGGGGGGGGGSSTPTAVTPVVPVQPTGIAANLVTSVPTYAFTDSDKQAAYNRLNTVRGTCGTGLLAYNAQLETAAQYHADYISTNEAAHPDAYSHIENPAYPGFKGAAPSDRFTLAGYAANGGGAEDFGSAALGPTTETDTVQSLLASVYHLASIFGSGNYDIGIATNVLATGVNVTVVELGAKTTPTQDIGSADVVTFPCNGTAVKTNAFGVARESPDPLPGHDYTASPIGQPIYIRVRVGQTLAISGFTVTNTATNVAVGQAALLTHANDPNNFLGVNEAVFIPSAPLAVGATYSVTINGTNNGVAFTRTYTFTTTS